jgi:uncharacterized protein with GYD domain
MPHYLWQATYRPEGAKGLLAEGGSKRRATVKQVVEAAGGKVHALYFAFGKDDVIGITEFPDNTTASAVALAVNASGAVSVRTTVLMTAEEVDGVTKKAIAYRAPGAKG